MPQPRLVLRPASSRGWFGGRGLVADGTAEITVASIPEAGDALQAVFAGARPGVVAVLLRYDGACTIARFPEYRWVDTWPDEAPAAPHAPLTAGGVWDTDPRAYRRMVEDARERIADGDVYVLNLTAQLDAELAPAFSALPNPAAAVFDELSRRSPADMAAVFSGLTRGATSWIASVSPERFVRVRRDPSIPGSPRVAEVCPIKGTRPRGATPDADRLQAMALAADPKERAEHVMVVDLERNDLGRVCEPGSIVVDPLYDVIATPYCHQMVSCVRGAMRDDASFGDLLSALAPCGSVTGAPKSAAMRIAAELEATARGAYCGALLVAIEGELDSSVLIRTLECPDPDASRVVWGAGCGIVHDSDPAAEWLELQLKATPISRDGAPPVALRETMRVVRGRVPLLARHLARLASGGCGAAVLASVSEAVDAELRGADPAASYGRLGVTVGVDGAVSTDLSEKRSTLDVPDGPLLIPIAVAAAPMLPPGAAKPADRSAWDAALGGGATAFSDEVQAVLVAPDGTLIDGMTASVWLVKDGALSTPSAPPAVAGVAREVVFDVAGAQGIAAAERPVTLFELELADEVFFSNAVMGVVAARARGGAVTDRIAGGVAERMGLVLSDDGDSAVSSV